MESTSSNKPSGKGKSALDMKPLGERFGNKDVKIIIKIPIDLMSIIIGYVKENQDKSKVCRC